MLDGSLYVLIETSQGGVMRQANIHVVIAAKLVYDVNNTLDVKTYETGSASVLLLCSTQG